MNFFLLLQNIWKIIYKTLLFLVIFSACTQKVSQDTIDNFDNDNQLLQTQFEIKLQYEKNNTIAVENRLALLYKNLTDKQKNLLKQDSSYTNTEKTLSEQITMIVSEYSITLDSLKNAISDNNKFIIMLSTKCLSEDEIKKQWDERIHFSNNLLNKCNEYNTKLKNINKQFDELIVLTRKKITSN